jgi:hypothetical protein
MAGAEQIIDFIESREYELKYSWITKDVEGVICFEPQIIAINICLLVVETFIHEYLHYKHPELEEEQIIAKTTRYIKRLTKKELFEIMVKFNQYVEG